MQPGADTSLGGERRDFPSTCWSRFLDSRSGQPKAGQTAFEELARHYWKPVYAFIRTFWSKGTEDAKDLTQDFFLWMLEGDFIARADRDRGRFRSFLKTALRNYLANEEEAQRRLKRGGGRRPISLEAAWAEAGPPQIPDPAGRSPEDMLDEVWRQELLTGAVARLEECYRREGKEAYFHVFRDFVVSPAPDVNYEQLAQRYGVTATDVSNYLMHAKRRFRLLLRELVAETVQADADLTEELKALFGRTP